MYELFLMSDSPHDSNTKDLIVLKLQIFFSPIDLFRHLQELHLQDSNSIEDYVINYNFHSGVKNN